MPALSNLSVDFTLNNLELLLLTGGIVGLVTGQLMKSRGKNILVDLVAGLFGTLVGALVLYPLLGFQSWGFPGALSLTLVGSIVFVVLAHFGVAVQRKTKAA